MLGAAGPGRELNFLPDDFPGPAGAGDVLPVLIGSGTGAVLEELLGRLESAFGPDVPLAVVDKEEDILAANGARARFAGKNIFWPASRQRFRRRHPQRPDPLAGRPRGQGAAAPAQSLLSPPRSDHYAAIKTAQDASSRTNFWDRARYAKLQEPLPRMLMLNEQVFSHGRNRGRLLPAGRTPPVAASARRRIRRAWRVLSNAFCPRSSNSSPTSSLPSTTWAWTVRACWPNCWSVCACPWHPGSSTTPTWCSTCIRVWSIPGPPSSPGTCWTTWIPCALGFERVAYLPLGVDVQRFLPPDQAPDRPSGRSAPGLGRPGGLCG